MQTVVTNRHVFVGPPDTVFLMTLCVSSGVLNFLEIIGKSPVDTKVHYWTAVAWAVVLTSGAMFALVGIYWKNPITGLEIESAGRWMLGPTSLAYALALWGFQDLIIPALFVAAFGITCLFRIRDIRRILREWKAYASGLG